MAPLRVRRWPAGIVAEPCPIPPTSTRDEQRLCCCGAKPLHAERSSSTRRGGPARVGTGSRQDGGRARLERRSPGQRRESTSTDVVRGPLRSGFRRVEVRDTRALASTSRRKTNTGSDLRRHLPVAASSTRVAVASHPIGCCRAATRPFPTPSRPQPHSVAARQPDLLVGNPSRRLFGAAPHHAHPSPPLLLRIFSTLLLRIRPTRSLHGCQEPDPAFLGLERHGQLECGPGVVRAGLRSGGALSRGARPERIPVAWCTIPGLVVHCEAGLNTATRLPICR